MSDEADTREGRRVMRRRITGSDAAGWKGDAASVGAGRRRARRLYALGPCEVCGQAGTERHHRDGNPLHNERENILIVCRRCHVHLDGRADRLTASKGYEKQRAAPKDCHECGCSYKPLRRGLCARCYGRKRQRSTGARTVLRGGDHPRARLSWDQAAHVRALLEQGLSRRAIAEQLGVNLGVINGIARGTSYRGRSEKHDGRET